MDGDVDDLERIAQQVHETTGLVDRIDAVELAQACGLVVIAAPGETARVLGDRITVGSDVRPSRLHGLVAHELAHWLLDEHGVDSDEPRARYLAGALLVPWHALDTQLRRVGLDLEALRALHPHASLELLARRVTALRDAVGCVYDHGAFGWRFASPTLFARRRPTALEHELAMLAHRTREPVAISDACASLAIDGDWVRVVTLARCEGTAQALSAVDDEGRAVAALRRAGLRSA